MIFLCGNLVYIVNYFIFAVQRKENVALGSASAYSAKKCSTITII